MENTSGKCWVLWGWFWGSLITWLHYLQGIWTLFLLKRVIYHLGQSKGFTWHVAQVTAPQGIYVGGRKDKSERESNMRREITLHQHTGRGRVVHYWGLAALRMRSQRAKTSPAIDTAFPNSHNIPSRAEAWYVAPCPPPVLTPSWLLGISLRV